MNNNEEEFQFDGFDLPNTTPVPDIVFDRLLHFLTGNELKVLLYIIRRTYGFGKNADAISLSQFREGIKTKEGKQLDKGCGLEHNRTILVALQGLEEKGCIVSLKRKTKQGDKDVTIYKLHFKSSPKEVVTPSNHRLLPEVTTGSYSTSPRVVTPRHQQETVIQQTDKQETVNKRENAPAQTSVPSTPDNKLSPPVKNPDIALMDTWDDICGERIPRDRKHKEAAAELARCGATREDLINNRDFCLRTNPQWYEKNGVDLAAIARNWGKWKSSLSQAPQQQQQQKPTSAVNPNSNKHLGKYFTEEQITEMDEEELAKMGVN